MIKTIIFDLSEVYLNGLLGCEKKVSKLLNLPEDKIIEGFNSGELNAFFKGKMSEEEYWRSVLAKTGWEIDIDSLKKEVRQNFGEIQGTRKIIEILKEKKFKLGLLSVHSREWIEYCESKFDFHKLFDCISYSFNSKNSKPDRLAFLDILNNLKTEPNQCIFIDDSVKNISAAIEVGINTILFKSPEQLRNDLKAFSIYLD